MELGFIIFTFVVGFVSGLLGGYWMDEHDVLYWCPRCRKREVRVWCAMCGKWGEHASGECPELTT